MAAMTISLSSLVSSFSSLSFSSHVSLSPTKLVPFPKPNQRICLSAVMASDLEGLSLQKYGITAYKIIAAGPTKRAIADAVLKEGSGKPITNHFDAKEYLQRNPLWLQYVKTPFLAFESANSYDNLVKAHVGGFSGQARATLCASPKNSEHHRSPLKKKRLLTRDAHVVVSKNVLKKARKAPQFSCH